MAPSGGAVGDEFSIQVDVEDGQWEDYTCQGSFEELVRSVELVLREWRACGTDLVVSNEAAASGSPPMCSYSRTLEHDGQLFSIQLVPAPDHVLPSTTTTTTTSTTTARAPEYAPTTPRAKLAATTTAAVPEIATASEACELRNRQLDFASCAEVMGDATITPLHRWFGLKQYVLLRALGEGGQAGMGVDQLLWTTTVAAGNCQCSVPVLVSCDWDGLVDEHGAAGGGVQSGASCKGYSAPGSKGVACSVRFQTAWTEKPPPEFLYLDGLTDLFLSKIRDAHCLPGRAFAPVVSTTVQQSWEWTKPEGTETPMPAPALPWERAGRGGSGAAPEEHASSLAAAVAAGVTLGEGQSGTGGSTVTGGARLIGATVGVGSRVAAAGENGAARGVVRARQGAVRELLRAIGGGCEDVGAEEKACAVPVWGPEEDPLVSLSVRVRWTELREGLVEESQHYTTLDPLPEEEVGGAGSAGVSGAGSGGQWFVSPRWRPTGGLADANGSSNDGVQRRQGEGRLGDACCRLLGALVLTTAMHPGTLMADLGAGPPQDGPTAVAEEYGKAASAALSAETREAVEVLCSKVQSPSIGHDEIDLILRHLLHPRPEQERGEQEGEDPDTENTSIVTGEGQHPHPPSSLSRWKTVYPGRAAQEGRRTSSEWTQVYPRREMEVDGTSSERRELGQRPQATVAATATAASLPKADTFGGGRGGAWGPWKLSAAGRRRGGAVDERTREERSLWAWAERGGVPIGRLLSLLSLRIASCEDLSSMSLLWMSFVRDVRLLWEDGAALARMGPIPEVDGTSMFDRSVGCTGQDRSVASKLRGHSQALVAGVGGGGALAGNGRERQDGSLTLYPDTRMCLIWQKLQMLNCCRAGVLAQAESQPPPGGEEQDDEEDEDYYDEEDFYDTQEYYQTSDDEDAYVGGGAGGGRPEGAVDDGRRQGNGGLGGGEGGIGETAAGARDHSPQGDAGESIDNGSDDRKKPAFEGPQEVPDASDGSVRRLQHGEAPSVVASSGEESSATISTTTAGDAAASVPMVEAHRTGTDEPEPEPPSAGDAKVKATSTAASPSPEEPESAAGPLAEDIAQDPPPSATVPAGMIGQQATVPVRSTAEEVLGTDRAGASSEQSTSKDDEERPRTAASPCGEEPPTSPKPEHTPAGEMGCNASDGGDVGGRIPSDEAPPSASAGVPRTPPLEGEEIWGSAAVAASSTTEEASLAAAAPSGNIPDSSAMKATAATAANPDESLPPMCRLLCTGATVRHPRLQDSGPVTGDMLEQQALGHASTYRGREVLLADMKAFLMENVDGCGSGGGGGGVMFADFVRWYRPECWQSTATVEEWVGPSEDRVGGAKEDDRRLAWPGQGQILWKSPLASHVHSEEDPGVVSTPPPPADPLTPSATPSVVTLAGWLSCWGDAVAALEEARVEAGWRALELAPLFRDVKEGEKALHFLETISPGSLLVQLLSGLLGLSIFVLEEGCSEAGSLPGVQASVEAARRKVVEAVELLDDASMSMSPSTARVAESSTSTATAEKGAADEAGAQGTSSCSSTSSCGGDGGGSGGNDGDGGGAAESSAEDSTLSPFRVALLSADGACVAVKKAENALARAVSLQRSLPGQKDLVNAIVTGCNDAGGGAGETPVTSRSQKEFLRDLLLAQGIQKTPGSELDDLLASYDEEHRQEGLKDGSSVEGGGGGGGGGGLGSGVMPRPRTKEYVLRCQTPGPFCTRNVGRGQMDAYPTPPSRMYAKTDGKNLRVALSLCESEI
eukprot:g3912.t1